MNMLIALMAVRSFVVITPETAEDGAAAAMFSGQVRQLLRTHRDETFRVLDLGRFLRGKSAPHVAPRKQAASLLAKARQHYAELDVEGAVVKLREALQRVEAGLASRKGLSTWLSIRIELGLRLWELEDVKGEKLVAETLAFAPKHPLPPDTQLSEAMQTKIDSMRRAKPGDQSITFQSATPMRIEVGAQRCVSPCTIKNLPQGQVPYRALAPGMEAMGGVLKTGDTHELKPQGLKEYAALIEPLKKLWVLEGPKADALLAQTKAKLPAPHLVWFQVSKTRVAMLRGQMVPKAALFYRAERPRKAIAEDGALLAWIKAGLADSAEVGPPISAAGTWHKFTGWWAKNRPKMPSITLPKVSRRTVVVSGVTLAGAAAIAGVAVLLARSPETPHRSYNPVLGY